MSLPKVYKSTGPVGRYYFCETGKLVPDQCIKNSEGKKITNPDFIKTLKSKYNVVDKKQYMKEAEKTERRDIEKLSVASIRNNKSDLPKYWKEKGLYLSPSACNELWKMSKGDLNKINNYIIKSKEANQSCNSLLYGPTRGFYMSNKIDN